MKNGKFFTLVELLVVIGIIAVLAAMLMPALGKAREKAKQTECINNLKNFSLSTTMYSNDNRSLFPYLTNGAVGNGVYGGWIRYENFPCPVEGIFDIEGGTLFSYLGQLAASFGASVGWAFSLELILYELLLRVCSDGQR